MTDRTSAYADAIVAMATGEGALDVVENELGTVARAVQGAGELSDQLADTSVPVSQRLRFIEAETLTAAHPVTRAALAMVIAADRGGDLADIAIRVAERAAEARDREVAEVTVAAPLDEARTAQLQAALESATGKALTMRVFVDPDVVGGVRARVGDTVIDGSIAKRFSDIRTRISS